MTNTPHAIVERPGERGSGLVMVLLLLMLMSALVAALATSGQTETFISRNQNAAAQAQAAAEAGLSHAVEVAVTYIFEFNTNGWPTPNAAIASLLVGPDGAGNAPNDADNGSLGARPGISAAEAIEPLALVPIAGTTLTYTAVLMDDSGIAGALAEDGSLFTDANKRLLVRATGFGPDNTAVTLEAVIGPAELPGVVTNGDLEINGSVTIDGTGAGVHANGDFVKSGGSGDLQGVLSTSGEYTGPSIGVQTGVRDKQVPEVRASDYLSRADYILSPTLSGGAISGGTITNQAGTVLANCDKSGCSSVGGAPAGLSNWDLDLGSGAWSFNSAEPPTGTYYVKGDVSTTASPTVAITLIAEGSIDITGSAEFTPHTPELLFVTDKDLKIRGLDMTLGGELIAQGQMLVHGQIDIFGNVDLLGQLIVEDTPGAGTLVPNGDNFIGGSVTITYNGGLGGHMYGIDGWRDIRDAD